MSSTYHRSSSPSASSSDSGSSFSSSPTRGIYVPLHKRSTPSSTTSVSEASSSRPSSPSKALHAPGSPTLTPPPTANPRIYTTGYLLSLRPFATEGLKEQMRTTCAEVVMNRRMRKSIEFNENQARAASKALLAQQRLLQQQLLLQQQQQAVRAHGHQRHAHLPAPAHAYAPAPPAHAHVAAFDLALPTPPRRARPTERNLERRREGPIQHNGWSALGNANSALAVA